MHMQFSVSGFGVGYRLGSVSYDKTAVLYFRDAEDEADYALKISDTVAAGQSGPSIAMTLLVTELFNVNESKHRWLFDPSDLVGREATFTTSGTSMVLDKAVIDASLKVLDEKHQKYEHTLALKQIPVRPGSWQVGGFSVRGKLKTKDSNSDDDKDERA